MTPLRRWLLVALVAVEVFGTPTALALLPVASSSISATALRERIAAAGDVAWSGEASTRGSLQVPDTDSFGGLSTILGQDSDLRVWWRDAEHFRVDRIRTSGEQDLIRDGGLTTRWTYESATATVTPYSPIRLPDVSDVLPPTLAAVMLAGARPGELSRLDPRRVAGHDSPGLRLEPEDDRSTIDHVDVWADADSGLPTRVEVYAVGSPRVPILSSALTSLDLGTPALSTTRFTPALGVEVELRRTLDAAAGANAYAPFTLPHTLAGLGRRGDADQQGAVGIYGRGPTAVIAIPLRRSIAEDLARQLRSNSSSSDTEVGTRLEVGPLSVLLSTDGPGTFLLAGSVTPQTLTAAAGDLRDGVSVLRGYGNDRGERG